MTLERAIDVFGEGFGYTRTFTHPFEYLRVGKLRVMRDLGRTRGAERVQEILVYGLSADEAIDEIRRYSPAKFFLCAIHDLDVDEVRIKEDFKSHGFRLHGREQMFVRDLNEPIEPCHQWNVRRVASWVDAEAIRKVARRQILDEDIHDGDAKLRLYVCFEDDVPIGWVRSIRTHFDSTWVSNLHVVEPYRRQGVASALMATMLGEDRRYGVQWSVLLASASGAKLYPRLGYRQIGLLQMFSPIKSRWT
ncbi:MAG: GNAT family N-acetyltransferase [Fimbriimonadaceae bacterium]|nr:GNAT family N-acetyltransferase [Fimbriimonadaceae bacterium]